MTPKLDTAAVFLAVGMVLWLVGRAVIAVRERRKRTSPAECEVKLQTVATVATTHPFRENGAETFELPPLREVTPVPLETVLATLRRAGLAPTTTKRGFDLAGATPEQYLRVATRDRERVLPTTLRATTNEAESAIDLAHALVPVFGPLAVDFKEAGWILVDGTRDVASLRVELSERYRQLLIQMGDTLAALHASMPELSRPSANAEETAGDDTLQAWRRRRAEARRRR